MGWAGEPHPWEEGSPVLSLPGAHHAGEGPRRKLGRRPGGRGLSGLAGPRDPGLWGVAPCSGLSSFFCIFSPGQAPPIEGGQVSPTLCVCVLGGVIGPSSSPTPPTLACTPFAGFPQSVETTFESQDIHSFLFKFDSQ